jgi:hypothetical protein
VGRVQALMMGMTAALALAVGAAGCGGGDDDAGASTPKGFQSKKTDDFSVALPSGWKIDQNDVQGGKGVFVEARPPGSDINRAQLRVASAREYDSDISSAVQLAEGEIPVRRPGATRVVSKPIDVPGASDARRVEWTVPAGGGIDAARIVTVLALSSNKVLVNLSMGVSQSQAAAARIDDVVRSLRVGWPWAPTATSPCWARPATGAGWPAASGPARAR